MLDDFNFKMFILIIINKDNKIFIIKTIAENNKIVNIVMN